MKRPEQALHQAVYKFIRYKYPHILAFHVPNGGYRTRFEGAIFKSMGVMPGVADLLLFWRGGMGAIELKHGKGKQTDHQGVFEYQWKHCGGQYAICKSIDDVEAVIEAWGAGRV